MNSICQSCRKAPAEVVEGTDDPHEPYELCHDCHHRLTTLSLRPREWYNLASIHGHSKYHLHDDFYDESGDATQPRAVVIDAAQHSPPTLKEVALVPDELLSYAITRWHVRADLIGAMTKYDTNLWLSLFSRRLAGTKNPAVINTVFRLCGHVLGQGAAGLVRQGWDEYQPIAFPGLSYAMAKCLPVAEGHAKVTHALSRMGGRERCEHMHVLSWFETPLTLDWIEDNIQTFSDAWGHVAASSRFDWPRARKWLSAGRPLSLVALDALMSCVRYDTALHREQKPRLMEPPTSAEFVAVLQDYSSRDDVPRVNRRVAFLLVNANTLLSGT